MGDAAKGFGGKFGVQKDRVDKSAVGFEHQSELSKHTSQTDGAKGFGGKFGVQKDRVDKAAHSFEESGDGTAQYKTKIDVKGDVKNFRSRFENFGAAAEEENKRKVEEEKRKRDLEFKRQVEASKKKEAAEEEQRAKEEQLQREEEERRRAEEDRRESEARRLEEERLVAEEQRRTENQSRVEEEQTLEQKRREVEQRRAEEQRREEERIAEERRMEEEKRLAEERRLDEERAAAEMAAQQPSATSSGKQAKAIYDYVAGDDDEISFAVGDLITQIEMIDDGWATGSVHGKKGMFPIGYAEIVEDQSPSKPTRSQPQPVVEPSPPAAQDMGQCGIALYDYDAADSDEISFAEGEEITNIEMPDPGWWIGICRGKRGIFPKAYIQLNDAAVQQDLGKCGTAIYDYEAAADDETGLTEGGRVTNIEIIDEGWWIGISGGRKGMFPSSYVQLD